MQPRKLMIGLLVIASMLSLQIQADCNCRVVSQSFVSIRPPFQVSSPERLAHFRDDRVEAKEDGWWGAVQVVPLGGQTTKGDDIATYWGPDCNKTLNS